MKLAVLCLLLIPSPVVLHAADPTPTPPPFILPPSPTPTPPPTPPNSPVTLVSGYPFVIRVNAADLSVMASPDGFVKVTYKAEPVTVVDAGGNSTDYAGDKGIYIVSACKAGSCELLIAEPGQPVTRVSLVAQGPTPPTPPTPPTNPLTATFQAAYTADGPDAASLAYLQSLFTLASTSQSLMPNPLTVSSAQAWLQSLESTKLPATAVPKLRAAIAGELTATFGATGTTPLTPAALATELGRVATALQGVK